VGEICPRATNRGELRRLLHLHLPLPTLRLPYHWLQEYGYEVSIIRRQCNTLSTRSKLAEEAPIRNTCHSRSSGGPPLIATREHSTGNRASAQRCFVVPGSKRCHRGAQKVVRESSKDFRGWSTEFWYHVHYQRLSFQVTTDHDILDMN